MELSDTMINDIEQYDFRAEQHRLSAFSHSMERAEQQNLAVQNAMREHPVAWFVKHLPRESTKYPAIEYLTLAEQVGAKTAQQAYDMVHSGSPDQEGFYHLSGKDGQEILFRPDDHRFIEWCMPGSDRERPKLRHCGLIRSKSGNGYVYKACPNDIEHHNQANRQHCWGLGCYVCMNDTAIRDGVKVDKHFLTHQKIWEKSGERIPPLGHWVVSPPQEWAKCMVQDKANYDRLVNRITRQLQRHGALGGITVFHPWRQFEQLEWRFSPHFHVIMYGFIDTRGFLRENEGWIIKKIHAKQGVNSIRHTFAYLSTHMGLGVCEYPAESVPWQLDFLDYMIPGIKSKKAHYTEKDYEDLSKGKGRMAGDLSGMDWDRWVQVRLTRKIRVRYWGALSKNKLRTLGTFRQYMYRTCRECGEILRTYDGPDDHVGEPVRYIREIDVKVASSEYRNVKREYDRVKDRMRAEGMKIMDFAKIIPSAASTLELDLPKNNDIVADGPFDRPDEYYLKRQRRAYSKPESPLDDDEDLYGNGDMTREGDLQVTDAPYDEDDLDAEDDDFEYGTDEEDQDD